MSNPTDAEGRKSTEAEIATAIAKLKYQGKGYVDIRDRETWSRGFDAGVQAARMILNALNSDA